MRWDEIIERIFDLYGNPSKIRLSEMLGIHKAIVSQWKSENPKTWRHPSLEQLRRVANDKGVTLDWLIEGLTPKYRKRT